MTSKQRWGARIGSGTVIAGLLGAVAACGSAFGSEDDCMETRTCPKPDEGYGGAVGESGDNVGGEDSSGAGSGGDDSSLAGSGNGEVPAECSLPGDCSNADASDGEEACVNGTCMPGNAPPTVVSVTPSNEAASVEPDASVVIELNEPLDPATVTPENVRILDGDEPVAGKLSYTDNEITFVPDEPLALLAPYAVSLSTGITDVAGAALAEAFSSTFKVRDGSWAVQTVVSGGIGEVSPTIQLTDAGEVLVAWIGEQYGDCPTTARWFNRGLALASAKTLNNGRDNYCRTVRSAVSRNGLALLSWYEEGTVGNNIAMAEFRDGKWNGTTTRSERRDIQGAVAVGQDGTLHYIGSDQDVQAWHTTPAGVWSSPGKALAPRPSLNDPEMAVAANGDAVAVWRDEAADGRHSVHAARFSSETATWSSAAAIPGSLVSPGPESTRGAPQVGFDAADVPVIVWRRGDQLVATHYDVLQAAWAAPQPISGEVTGLTELEYFSEPPALVFDGDGFVVAFTVLSGSAYDNYVVRYDSESQVWQAPELVSTAAARGSARMPRLTADARGNLLLVWATAQSAGVYEFVARRFDASTDTWSDPATIPGATMKNAELARGVGTFALGGNRSGLAAISFSDRDAGGYLSRLQLASFY